ncbi:hypothetical protein PYCCODRAFT_1369193 [Trametes coccinea BRFM310]|uniref:Late embryogenesis abundant protein LEA-2 subgroup domain-containing protein n=1 Tax=Trametes coccinea (strain BRFM310) TaxID=1353009 RepID=A0A1Y2IK89_TRAC3|nr:hypothetical protein PYCCODRAFT_1369193 [Trametes coccinea BRFM310]
MAAYRDPYAGGQYPQQYQDAPFNPYEVQQHQTERYADGGDDYDAAGRAKENGSGLRNGYGHGEDVVPVPMGEKSSRNMRRWRYEHQGEMWTKGSRAGCFGRFFCCTIMIFLFLAISIILSLALWLTPPNIIVGTPTPDLNSFNIDADTESISLGMPVNISVNNPNYFSVTISSLDAQVIYPINNTQIGFGHMGKLVLHSHEQTNFTFPVTVSYNATSDPNGDVVVDLAKHCGIDPSVQASDVSLTVYVKVALKILSIPISHTITQKVSFSCPLSGVATQLEDLLKALGINLDDIGALFN